MSDILLVVVWQTNIGSMPSPWTTWHQNLFLGFHTFGNRRVDKQTEMYSRSHRLCHHWLSRLKKFLP